MDKENLITESLVFYARYLQNTLIDSYNPIPYFVKKERREKLNELQSIIEDRKKLAPNNKE